MHRSISLLLLTLTLGCGAGRDHATQLSRGAPTTRASYHATITKTIGYDYLILRPRDHDAAATAAAASTPRRKYPLILYLHGSGDCGKGLDHLANHALPKIAGDRADFPFVLVAPQMANYDGWWSVESLDALLDHILATEDIDPDGVYLTGISLGAYGAWDWACRRPQAFAAIAPIAGSGNDDWADQLRDVPVWAFHGAKDKSVTPVEEARMVNAVIKAGGDAKLTIYPDLGHNAWDRAYSDPALFQWLLSHKRVNRR
jgi:predicted peptidase